MRIRILFCPFESVLAVVFIQIIQFDDINQPLCIAGIRCIAGLFQSACPSFIIRNLQTEQESITCTRTQKLGMIPVRFTGMPVGTETFARSIIVMTHCPPFPGASTLNAEMVI